MGIRMNGSQLLCESLVREGVVDIFGLPGGAILPLYQTLPEYPQLRHILTRHEQGAAHAADGYGPRNRQSRRMLGHVRPRSDQPRNRHRDGPDGLHSDRCCGRTGGPRLHWYRRLPGDRHHGHHPPDHQAQHPGYGPRRDPAGCEGSLPHRRHRQAGSCCHRRAQGRADRGGRAPVRHVRRVLQGPWK